MTKIQKKSIIYKDILGYLLWWTNS